MRYAKLWHTAFKSQAICLHWSPDKSYLIVGCDNGEIIPIEIKLDEPDDFNELKRYKVHKSRIMDIWVDGDKNCCYTVSEDKYLHCFDFKLKQVVTSEEIFLTF